MPTVRNKTIDSPWGYYLVVTLGSLGMANLPFALERVGVARSIIGATILGCAAVLLAIVVRLRSNITAGFRLGTRRWQKAMVPVIAASFLMMCIAYPCLANSTLFDMPWLGYIGMALMIPFAFVSVIFFVLLVPFIVIDEVRLRGKQDDS
jgi:hypothetical protein